MPPSVGAPASRFQPRPRSSRALNRLILLAAAVFVSEAALYSAVVPLLPRYAESVGLGESGAGVLVATYAVGLIPGSLLAGSASIRFDLRAVTIAGVAGFSLATIGFGLATSVVALDVLRVAQGVAAGFMWGGSLAWLLGSTPSERRGEFLGAAFGISILGTLTGPVIGTIAVTTRPQVAFGIAGALVALLLIPLAKTPAPPKIGRVDRAALAGAARDGLLRLAGWLFLFSALAVGAISAVVPLQLSELGATDAEVGLTFLVASLITSVAVVIVGRVSDRRPSLRIARGGTVIAAAALSALALPQSWPGLAAATVLGMVAAIALVGMPGGHAGMDAITRQGLTPGIGASLLLVTLAIGEGLGATIGGILAESAGPRAPYLALAILAAVSYLAVTLGSRQEAVNTLR